MPILRALQAAGVAWPARHAGAPAASIFLGLAVPPLAAHVKPYLGETVFVLLLFSYLRTNPIAFRRYLREPGLILVAALWVMMAVPLIFGTAYALVGIREAIPALYTIMILQCAITSITSLAAFAALIGLDVAFSYLFLGTSLFSPIELGVKLFFFLPARAPSPIASAASLARNRSIARRNRSMDST